jgi:hypothetical protein
LTFSARSRATTVSIDRSSAARRSWSTVIWISSSRPPLILTAAVPSTASRSVLRRSSAKVRSHFRRSSSSVSFSLSRSARRMIGSLDGSKRSSTGRSASRGRSSTSVFSRTSTPAMSMSVPQVNSRITSDWPERDTERTRFTFLMTPTTSSIGFVIRFSTSSGAAPGSSVRTVSVG